MLKISRTSWLMAAVAAVGVVVPPASYGDDPAPAKAAETKATAGGDERPAIRDVSLTKEGAFAGRVVDEQGQAM
jgi:hypothetical protein